MLNEWIISSSVVVCLNWRDHKHFHSKIRSSIPFTYINISLFTKHTNSWVTQAKKNRTASDSIVSETKKYLLSRDERRNQRKPTPMEGWSLLWSLSFVFLFCASLTPLGSLLCCIKMLLVLLTFFLLFYTLFYVENEFFLLILTAVRYTNGRPTLKTLSTSCNSFTEL